MDQQLRLKPTSQYYLPFSSFSSSRNEFLMPNLLVKITEAFRRKLSLGANMLRPGGARRVFAQNFSYKEGEKLFKASRCYISTTIGPISGFLFISTNKIAFCSEKPIKFFTDNGDIFRFHYKVVIPLGKILKVNERRNVKSPSQKYIEIDTVDNYDFWFSGCLSYQKTLKHLQKAICEPY